MATASWLSYMKKECVALLLPSLAASPNLPQATVWLVPDTTAALQQLASYHRRQFALPVIGITGSNGKTIVKEWLFQLLHRDYRIVRSPKSYNSQIGVPLSVWQLEEEHQLGIFEAGHFPDGGDGKASWHHPLQYRPAHQYRGSAPGGLPFAPGKIA
jgi:UDP-N-acetylmuramyl pentapeptide synthase